jgi:hypothetical protein
MITVLGPSGGERSLDNRWSMALTPKFGVIDNIFKETLSLP